MIKQGELPLLGILRGIEEKHIAPLMDIFIKAEIKYIEITMNTDGASQLIKKVITESNDMLVIGAGTVLSLADLDEALDAGSKFIVSPTIKEDVIETCVKNKVPVFPGALTPTEIHKAWDLGATMVKLFPANLFGPSYIKSVKGPLDKLKIMAVGGVNEKNAGHFLKSGADGVAFGAGIIKPMWLAKERYDLIEKNLKDFIAGCKEAVKEN